jgi:hypothetical protein
LKHCEAIAIEVTPAGAIFQGQAWPEEIDVDRGLLEFPQGQHVQFGRRGSLQFNTRNGFAAYRRSADIAGGWRYVRTDHRLDGAAAVAAKERTAEPAPPVAAKRYKHNRTAAVVEAFQWLPHAVPPMALPEWFMQADFEHNRDGMLTVRNRSGVAKAEPSDWVILSDAKIVTAKSKLFGQDFLPA